MEDGAGRRAAYRAVDLALPLLRPGKSLKFASLPEGHDPDDLVRAGGREAINEVLGAARPLAQVLWMRETEAGAFDTPERRAALEARLGEVTADVHWHAATVERAASPTIRVTTFVPSGVSGASASADASDTP